MLVVEVLVACVAIIGELSKFLSFVNVGHRFVACICCLHRAHSWLTLGAAIVLGTISEFNLGIFMPPTLGLVMTDGGFVTCGTDPSRGHDGMPMGDTKINS